MTSSIVITNTVNLEFDKKNKFYYTDENMNTYEFQREEIPAVRYRFNHYGINELNYIKNSLKKFNYSVHIAEVHLDSESVSAIKLLSSLKEVAIFVYIDLYKENVVNKSFNESQRMILNPLKDSVLDRVERFMLKDVDGVLHMLVARPLVKSIASFLGVKEDKVGYCGCAFSSNGMCCLTAERARDIAARYSSNEHFAIATNAVEGKNLDVYKGCHCIRHILINHDMDILDETKIKTQKKKIPKEKVDKVVSLEGAMNKPFDADYKVDGQLRYDGEKIIEDSSDNNDSEDVGYNSFELLGTTDEKLEINKNDKKDKKETLKKPSATNKTYRESGKKKLKLPKNAVKF